MKSFCGNVVLYKCYWTQLQGTAEACHVTHDDVYMASRAVPKALLIIAELTSLDLSFRWRISVAM